jgi:hypothetical protein
MAATTYIFTPTSLSCYAQQNGQSDVVYNICWRYQASDGKYGYLTEGATTTAYIPGQPFIPYDQLTQDEVVSWIEESLGPVTLAQMQAQADAAIAAQYASPVVNPPLPWEQP